MKSYVFSDNFSEETVTSLVTFLNQHEHEEVHIYFYSRGGFTGLAIFLAYVINSREASTVIHVGDVAHSSAFVFLFNLNKKCLVFSPYLQTFSIVHAASTEVSSIRPNRDFSLNSVDNSNKFMSKEFSFFTDEERETFLKEDDVILNFERLKTVLNEKIISS